MNALNVVVLGHGDRRLDAVYSGLLAPSFPPDQLDTLADLREGMESGRARVLAAVDPDGRPLGTAIAEWYEEAGIVLLAYLAVDASRRSQGIGGRLLEAALEDWTDRFRPVMVVAEIERPSSTVRRPEWGDPGRRYAFYGRHGARALDLPYFQPALRPDSEREHGMLLIALAIDPSVREPGGVAAAPVRRFLEAYFTATEGAVPRDEEGAALLRAAARTRTVAAHALPRSLGAVPPAAAEPDR
ncbi:hypothetical protein GCM10009853_015440 [Glycomyces scopariae]